jgi:hypothetical protein
MNNKTTFDGAWMTDIDDTILPSGVTPDAVWIEWLSDKLRCLQRHRIAWVPMTGVAIDKLGPRILDRLPDDVRSHIIYYGGDGSQKYQFDSGTNRWKEDMSYRRVLTDAQALAVLGDQRFLAAFGGEEPAGREADGLESRRLKARKILSDGGFTSEDGFLGEMASILRRHGFEPQEAETYFRGGSISWMMLGDVSVAPYQTEEAIATRAELLQYGKVRLQDEGHLSRFGSEGIHIPFHGSRGIKFVLRNNDKERGTRDLMAREGLDAESVFFIGNELFDGGNDHVISRVKGVTLVSVGVETDPDPLIIRAGIGIEVHDRLLERACLALDGGDPWSTVVDRIRSTAVPSA